MDKKESQVKEIARNATSNNGVCGSLDGCSAACSRVTCHPLSGGRESLQCTAVDNTTANKSEINNICRSQGGCPNKMLLDYNKSFVRLPAPAYTSLSTEVAQDICLQRLLDSTFKTVSVPSEHSNVYFGSTSGAFLGFPGRELNETQCKSYDPRKRPWYLNGISVSRDVKILVDLAKSMGNQVIPAYGTTRPLGTTYLDVVKDITLQLLDAHSGQDYVEVFSFDSVTATSLGGAFLVNSSFNYFNPSGHSELDAVVADVKSLAQSSMTAALSDLNGAIRKAASSFNQLKSLKVIIVLSNGLFVVNSTTFPSVLDLQKAKLMVYKLPTNDDGGDTFPLKTSFQKDICSVNDSFESVDALATANPLYAMRSYFTYLAQIQLSAVGNNATWSNIFDSVSQDQIVIAPTYPAFGSDGLLIGVAGIDVVINELDETLQLLVWQEFGNRNRSGTLPAPSSISMTCYYQNGSAKSVCPGSTLPHSKAICPRNDTSSTLADRTCCGSCGSGESSKKSSLKLWIISLIAIAVIGLVAVVGVVIYYCVNHCRKAEPDFTKWKGRD